MSTATAKLIYFSPTGTTRRVLEGISAGLPSAQMEHLDLTLPSAMDSLPGKVDGDLAIIGVPVYGGRIPALAAERLQQLKGNRTPAVVVVTYGNRAYEDALLELSDLVTGQGFIPIAGGAFIGEHSFSSAQTPIAVGRPDTEDLAKARAFGERISEKLSLYRQSGAIPAVQIPGNSPYKQGVGKFHMAPNTKGELCTVCKACAKACPAGAITVDNAVMTDDDACIVCCACTRVCPTGARVMEHPKIQQIAERLHTNCSERREPEVFA